MNPAKWQETIDALKEEHGLQVRVTHLRRFKLRNQFNSGNLATIGQFRAMDDPVNDVSPLDVYEVDPRGGKTVVQLIAEAVDEIGPQVVIEVEVPCHKEDNYSKHIGRTKALGRALTELKRRQAVGSFGILEGSSLTPVGGTAINQ